MTDEGTTRPSFCRICNAFCSVLVTTRGDRVVQVRSDPDHPVSQGYSCPKGRAAAAFHHDPRRLDHPLIPQDGAAVSASSRHGEVVGEAEIDPGLRPGAVWIPHGWLEPNVGEIESAHDDVDPLTGMVRLSGVEVRVERATGGPPAGADAGR